MAAVTGTGAAIVYVGTPRLHTRSSAPADPRTIALTHAEPERAGARRAGVAYYTRNLGAGGNIDVAAFEPDTDRRLALLVNGAIRWVGAGGIGRNRRAAFAVCPTAPSATGT